MLSKNTSILIIGFGSIGQRHYRNLANLGFKNIGVFDPDNNNFSPDKDIFREKKLILETAKKYQAAFICSPNNLHVRQALICARAGCHLFIEKPLSHNLKDVRKLEKFCRKEKLITMVGCNLRFHPCLEFIKKYSDGKKLGKIYSISHEFGYYLPYWRPNQDYRKNYAVKRQAGGGIVLDDIHEVDLLFWLNNFSKAKKHCLLFNRAGNLKIKTEDQAVSSFLFENKVLGLVSCNYLDQNYSRSMKIVGARGSLEWSFKNNKVWLNTKDKREKIYQLKNYDFNQAYVDEVDYFFRCIENKKGTFSSLAIAAKILKYCLV